MSEEYAEIAHEVEDDEESGEPEYSESEYMLPEAHRGHGLYPEDHEAPIDGDYCKGDYED